MVNFIEIKDLLVASFFKNKRRLSLFKKERQKDINYPDTRAFGLWYFSTLFSLKTKMKNIPIIVQESLLGPFEFKQEEQKQTLNFAGAIESTTEELADEGKLSELLGYLIVWEIVKRANKRFKSIVKAEDVFTKTKGSLQILFVNPEDYEEIPEDYKKYTAISENIRKGEGLRLVNKGGKVSFKYNRLRIRPIPNKQDHALAEIQYDFNIGAFHLEYVII